MKYKFCLLFIFLSFQLIFWSCEEDYVESADLQGEIFIYDQNGNTYPELFDITVVLTSKESGDSVTALTDSSGIFLFTDLAHDVYLLSISEERFVTQSHTITIDHNSEKNTTLQNTVIIGEISQHQVNISSFQNDTSNQQLIVSGTITPSDTADEFNLILFFGEENTVSKDDHLFKSPNFCWCDDYPYVSETFTVTIPYGEIMVRHDEPESLLFAVGHVDNHYTNLGYSGSLNEHISRTLGPASNTQSAQ